MKRSSQNKLPQYLHHTETKGREEPFGTLAIFFLAIILMLFNNYARVKNFYVEMPDGTLYLSIAQNFIQNGHFIQTARPYEMRST